ncbi:hypothetical protein CLOBL_01750 [Clostridium sp. BL-8]|nr:hypothetical protein CLOBL_01750 [Clostridium sp. BL-8]
MQIKYMTLLMNWINFGLIILIIIGVYKAMLAFISKLSLFIGNLFMSLIIFFYMSFLHDLSQLSAYQRAFHCGIIQF